MTDPVKRHMLVKATVTEVTDEGTFVAVISTASVDRDGDIVDPAAVVKSLQAWSAYGKMVPLSWDHQYDTDFIIGHIVPTSVKATSDGEVQADGWIDQSIPRGKDAWRLVKSGTLGFSYGFLIKDAMPLPDGNGGLHITELDIFEVTATPIPANADTRIISYKSLTELKDAMLAVEQEEEARAIPDVVEPPPPVIVEPAPPKVEPSPALPNEVLRSVGSAIEREEEERRLPVVDPPPAPPEPEAKVEPKEPTPLPADALKQTANAVVREEEERALPKVDPPPPPQAHTPPAPPIPPEVDAQKAAAAAIEREETERNLPQVDPPPPPELHTPPARQPKPKSVSELRAEADAIEREEAERQIPEVEVEPLPEPVAKEPEPAKEPELLPVNELKRVADALERAEAERRIPHVDPPPAPPEPKVVEPEPEPKPLPINSLKKVADAVERAETERKLPDVTPPPVEPEPEPTPEPEPVLAPDVLQKVAAEVERRERERAQEAEAAALEAEVVDVEPVHEEGLVASMRAVLDKGPSDDELLVFARRVVTELGGVSLESLEAQVKRLERDERKHVEDAIVKSAEIDTVQAQVADAREALVALEHFEPSEIEGMKSGLLTTLWTSAYLNDLPDSAFLYVKDGGAKDASGKTSPRDLRLFPYKTVDHTVDVPHLRNALSQLAAFGLPKTVQDRLFARATRIMNNATTADATAQEKGAEGHGSRAVDQLRKQADDLALEFHSEGLDRQKPPRTVEPPKKEPEHDLRTLRNRMFEETLTLLSE